MKTKEIRVRLEDNIYEQLKKMAAEKGLSPNEMAKYIIGDETSIRRPQTSPTQTISLPHPILPPQVTDAYNKMERYLDLMVRSIVSQGLFKCPNCTMSLDKEAIETGICNTCGMKI